MAKKTKRKSKKTSKKPIFFAMLFSVIALLTILGLSLTYAFWSFDIEQEVDNEVESGCLSISYDDKNANNNVVNINLTNTYPMSDIDGMNLTPYTFKITNTCNLDAKVEIYLHSLAVSTLNDKYIKYAFMDISTSVTNVAGLSGYPKVELETQFLDDLQNKLGDIKDTYLLNEVSLEPKESVSYNLNLWIDESAPNSIMGQTYQAAISTTVLVDEE